VCRYYSWSGITRVRTRLGVRVQLSRNHHHHHLTVVMPPSSSSVSSPPTSSSSVSSRHHRRPLEFESDVAPGVGKRLGRLSARRSCWYQLPGFGPSRLCVRVLSTSCNSSLLLRVAARILCNQYIDFSSAIFQHRKSYVMPLAGP
jgi:hypothetical protein